jgi:hypothetical protein
MNAFAALTDDERNTIASGIGREETKDFHDA